MVRDLSALAVAVERLGGEVRWNQTTHAWWGTWLNDWQDSSRSAALKGRDPESFGTCTHAIGIKGVSAANGPDGPWEIGICAEADGTFKLVYDNYGSAGHDLESLFGKDLKGLAEEYGAEVAMRTLAQQGYYVTRQQVAAQGA